MTTGELIREARLERNMTQRQLANILGAPYQSIGQWERGVNEPRQSTLERIEIALGKNLDTGLGKWISWGDEYGYDLDGTYECPYCHEPFCLIDGTPKENYYNYCPKCGKRLIP